MSQENVEIVRSVLEPFGEIDIASVDWSSEPIRATIERAYSPDVELRTLESGIGSGVGAVYRGWDGLVAYLREWFDPFSEYRIDWLDYIEAGNCVLVPMRAWGIGSASGARGEISFTMLHELRAGQITRIHQYDTVEEALEAVGLSE
jgi:ketosteroid isomerase-like protein